MRICVAHEILYRYETPASGAIKTLRLTPRNHSGQYVVDWRIDVSADCRLEPQEDAFGNITHAFATSGPMTELRLMVEGEVETQDMAGFVRGAVERFPPSMFLRETALTQSDERIQAFAAELEKPGGNGDSVLSRMHRLMGRLHEDMALDDEPAEGTTAGAAFRAKHGAGRDLAHVFIATARALGVPSRFVAGYFSHDDGASAPDSGHYWAEAHVPELGWIGFDPVNRLCVTDQHVRVAVGLDYLGAAEVRGAHYGGGTEALAVKLLVSQAAWQTQG
jgi:transglutaminase-like putative cysteine protease